MQAEAGQPESTTHVDERSQEAQEEEALPAGYISRRTTDPYMQKKLQGIQVQQSVAASELPKS